MRQSKMLLTALCLIIHVIVLTKVET